MVLIPAATLAKAVFLGCWDTAILCKALRIPSLIQAWLLLDTEG